MIRVVLVEPHYGGNIGSVARLVKNFGAHELYLVNPHVAPTDREALRWAAHAKDVLESARVVGRLDEAVKDCAFVVATTGKPLEKRVARTPITPKQFANRFASYVRSPERIAILFGREPSGLTNEEMQMADLTVTIPASPVYPVLNLSHAVAVILYELYVHGRKYRQIRHPPTGQTLKMLFHFFSELVDRIGRDNPDEVKKIFRAVVGRGVRTEREAKALIGVFADVIKRWKGAE